MSLDPPSFHALAAMFVTLCMFIAFARGRMSVEIVSLLTIAIIAVGLYFVPLPDTKPTDGLQTAFSGFGHYALITICSLMIMGRGLVVTGALEPAARLLEGVFKLNLQLGLLVSLVIAFTLSMAVNDTPVLVLLLPIFVSLAARGAMPASKTLIPLNAAVLIGGMATTIGTSTNILVVSIAVDLGMPPMSVFHYTPIVLTAALVALPYLWLVMPRLLGDNRTENEHESRQFTTRLRLGPDSALTGQDLAAILPRLPSNLEFHDQPKGPLDPEHRLRVSGTHEALEEAMRTLKGEVAPAWVIDRIRRESAEKGHDILVVEMAVTADSRLISRTLPTSGVADLYGVAVLGIHRPRTLLGEKEQFSEGGDLRIQEGDVLLVMGLQKGLDAFARTDSLLILDGARRRHGLHRPVPDRHFGARGRDPHVPDGLREIRPCRACPVGQGHRAGRRQHCRRSVHAGQRGCGISRRSARNRLAATPSGGCAGYNHAVRHSADQFRFKRDGGHRRYADCLQHRHSARLAERAADSRGAVRLQPVLRDADCIPDEHADHG